MRFYAHLACVLCMIIGLVACDHRPGDGYDPEGVTHGGSGGSGGSGSGSGGSGSGSSSGDEESHCWEITAYDGKTSTTVFMWDTESGIASLVASLQPYYSYVTYDRSYDAYSEYSCQQLNRSSEPDPEPQIEQTDFLGVFTMTCTDAGSRETESWEVTIDFSSSAKRSNGYSWVRISGLYQGLDFMDAFGYYDPQHQCIRIPAGIPDKDHYFYYTSEPDISYYAEFRPCYISEDWSSFYDFTDAKDEMWLRMEDLSEHRLRIGPSDYSFTGYDGIYGNGWGFFYYYKSTDTEPEGNWDNIYTNAVLVRKYGYYDAPARAPRRDGAPETHAIEKNEHKPIRTRK